MRISDWSSDVCSSDLLVMLEIWRHGWRHVPLRYEVDDWDSVFPLGMYTVGTYELAQALQLDFLQIIPAIGVYVSLLVWALVTCGALARWYRSFRVDVRRHPPR